MRTFLRWLLRGLYGLRVYNADVLKTPGPVLLVPNHVSWLDWLFVAVFLEEDWKFVTSSTTAELSWAHRKIMVNRYTFPIDMQSPYAAKRIAEHLEKGGRLVLFAEGRISITGTLMKFFEGTGFLLHRSDAKMISCFVRGANRLPFVRHSGWTKWFPKVSLHCSDPFSAPKIPRLSTADTRKKLTQWLRDRHLEFVLKVEMDQGQPTPLGAIGEMARDRPGGMVLQDINRQSLNLRRVMAGARVLAGQWRKRFGETEGERIGMLLPNVNATPVTLLSLWEARKIPAILNFSSGMQVMISCAELAGFKRVISSRAFLERANIDPEPLLKAGLELIYLEDIRGGIGGGEKLRALFGHLFSPGSFIRNPPAEETAVVLFTSGSEGLPKGVELTHTNLIVNIRQMLAVIDLEDTDSIFNALPLFHSFGLAIGTLLPLVRGIPTFLYPSPLHYRVIPELIYEHARTVMLSTNTFLNGYVRTAHPYDFRSVRYLFAGAEKVQESTALTWSRRFGLRILEGYGTTECSPCVSVNTPMEPRHGSAGRLLPGIEHRIEPVEGVQDGGRLLVRGPNVMRGYLNPEANEQFKRLEGWYDTGDVARVDEDGFLFILGRLKRFAKISGEMVSLTAVEEALAGAFTEYGIRTEVAIVARPDDEKGEAVVAVTNEPRLKLDEIRSAVRKKGLPNLAAPRELKVVPDIPKLGTGKTNHRELEKMI